MKRIIFIALIIFLVFLLKTSSPSTGVLSQQDNSGKSSNAPGHSVENKGRSKKTGIFETPNPSESPTSPTPDPTFAPTPVPPPITTIIPIEPNFNSESPQQKIEVKTENLRNSVNLSEAGTQLKVERINGKVTIKAQKSDGEEIKLNKEDVIDMQSLFLPESVQEVPEVDLIDDKIYTLKYKNAIAESLIPLRSLLNEVIASTNYGEKKISFMPNEALETLVDKKIISGAKDISLILDDNGEVKALSRKVRLTIYDKKLAYEIEGIKREYFLGITPVEINKKITISEEDKKVLKIELSLKEKIKDFLSY